MKKWSLIVITLFLASTFISCAQKRSLMVRVTCVQPYCGGARPTPEMEEEGRKVKNYAGKMVIIVNATGKVDSAMTDTAGYIRKKMPFGVYKLFETWRYYKRSPQGEDLNELEKECIVQEWNKPFATVNFGKRMINVNMAGPIIVPCPYSVCPSNKIPIPRRE